MLYQLSYSRLEHESKAKVIKDIQEDIGWKKKPQMLDTFQHGSLPEWSKGVDSSSTSASCVGSNPTAVISLQPVFAERKFCKEASCGI